MADYFAKSLANYPEAISYLKERGVNQEMMDSGAVGFCPPYANHRFPLIRGRVVVPVRDVHGRIVAFAGRKFEPLEAVTLRAMWESFGHEPAKAQKRIDQWQRGKWINEPYPKGKHLFNLDRAKHAARERGFMVLVEGYMDALVLSANGLENTVASCGVALTEWHASLLARFCDHVVPMMDGDSAGENSREKIVSCLNDASLTEHWLKLPDGLDPDQLVLKTPDAGKRLRIGIERIIEGGMREVTLS